MIAYLSGTVKFVFDSYCILDVNGVGYKVFAATNALTVGDATEFFIHTAVRDDAINLYGFQNRDEFELFEMLINVSGIGAKGALAIVNKISPADFAAAVARQDLKALTNIPGVGKKSAERIILELKDKMKSLPRRDDTTNPALFDAIEALEALGYSDAEIRSVLDTAPKNSSADAIIKYALSRL